MRRWPNKYAVAAGTRWGAWLVVLLLLANNGTFALPSSSANAVSLVLFSYITVYTVIWTRQLPQIITRVNDGSVLVLYDLLLSMLPVWPSGGWVSPFLPFALSVLVVPTLGRGWRTGALVGAILLALDQIILWTTPRNPWEIAFSDQPITLLGHTLMVNGSLALLARTLLPFGVVAATVGLVAAHERYRKRRSAMPRRVLPQPTRERPRIGPLLDDTDDTLAGYGRASDPAPQVGRGWPKDRAAQPTLERSPPASILGALHHAKPDLAAAGVTVIAEIAGDEAQLAPKARALVAKALEIALDNVVMHAHAKHASVDLRIAPAEVVLSIADDGIGLFDGTPEPPGFHQLKRLRFRVTEMGGALRVEERPEGGVLFELRVPLASA